jgi:hypothetical protein
MNRGLVAIGAGAVILGGFAIYAVLGSHDDAPASQDASHGRRITEADPGNRGKSPRPPSAQTPGDSGDGSATDYMVGDVRVRDHRAGDHPQVDLPPAVRVPGGRKVASKVTFDLAQQLRPLVIQCGGNVPKDARGDKPRADGEITMAIKDHQAVIATAAFQLRDVTGDYAAAVKTCLEQKSVGVSAPAGDEADLEGYPITLSLRLP